MGMAEKRDYYEILEVEEDSNSRRNKESIP